MAKVNIDGKTVELLPHEVIDLIHSGKITGEEGWRALGMQDIKLNLIFENDGIALAKKVPYTGQNTKADSWT